MHSLQRSDGSPEQWSRSLHTNLQNRRNAALAQSTATGNPEMISSDRSHGATAALCFFSLFREKVQGVLCEPGRWPLAQQAVGNVMRLSVRRKIRMRGNGHSCVCSVFTSVIVSSLRVNNAKTHVQHDSCLRYRLVAASEGQWDICFGGL